MAISFSRLHVLNPPLLARRLLWHVLSIGAVSRDEPENHAGMDKAGLFLFRVQSGRGVLELADTRFDLFPGPVWWLLDLAQPRRYVPSPGVSLVTASVRFNGPGIDPWRDELFRGRSGLRLSSRRHAASLRSGMDALTRLKSSSSDQTAWRMHEILSAMLGVLLQAQDLFGARHADVDSPARRVVQAVHGDPTRDWHAEELSRIVGVGYSSLRQHFKETQGETLHDFLQRTRLDQARSRLTDPRLTVKAIALQLNFSSEFYFSRWFRRSTGLSPSGYRATLRG